MLPPIPGRGVSKTAKKIGELVKGGLKGGIKSEKMSLVKDAIAKTSKTALNKAQPPLKKYETQMKLKGLDPSKLKELKPLKTKMPLPNKNKKMPLPLKKRKPEESWRKKDYKPGDLYRGYTKYA